MRAIVTALVLAPLLAAAPAAAGACWGGATESATRVDDLYLHAGKNGVELWRETNGLDGLQRTAQWCWDEALGAWMLTRHADRPENALPAPSGAPAAPSGCLALDGSEVCA